MTATEDYARLNLSGLDVHINRDVSECPRAMHLFIHEKRRMMLLDHPLGGFGLDLSDVAANPFRRSRVKPLRALTAWADRC